jgi:hypothetical protein
MLAHFRVEVTVAGDNKVLMSYLGRPAAITSTPVMVVVPKLKPSGTDQF